MGWSYLVDLFTFLFRCYPEILLAMACFFSMHLLSQALLSKKSRVLVNWPIVGMLPSLLCNADRLHDWTTEILTRCGGTFLFSGPWLTGIETLVTCDPANVHHILITNFSNFPKGSDYYEMLDFLGDGIFNADSESWRLQRKIAHAHMNSIRFRRYLAKTSQEILETGLIPVLSHVAHKGDVVDLQDVLLRFTFDSACTLIFGINPRCLSVNFPTIPFMKAMDDAEEAIFSRYVVPVWLWKLQRWLHVGKEKKLAKAWNTVDHFIAKYISIRREELKELKDIGKEKGVEEGKDLLTFYMESQLQDEMGRMKYDKFLRDTTLNLFIAGRGTTSATLTWFFWLVSTNPTVETKILEELNTNLPQNDENPPNQSVFINTNVLSKLIYLHATFWETLRLFPPVPFDQKGVMQQEVLPSGDLVRPGKMVMYIIYAMGRMEWIWGKDCLEFKPERWISERGHLKFEPAHKFSAFNAGPRICLGKDMAMTQMKAVAASVLYNFHVEVLGDHPVFPRTSLLLFMKHGLKVRVRTRCV